MTLSMHLERLRIHDTGGNAALAFTGTLRAAGDAVCGFAHAFSESCRRIRAYNDLANLTPQALQDLGRQRDDLDRVIAGETPRSGWRRPPERAG